jgi:hypothetical protein
MNYNSKITDYIENATPEHSEILSVLRKLIHETVENVSEEIKWGFPVFAKEKDFAYMRFSKKHITLGFYNIEKLVDPDNLLEGDGNTLKHIKIKSLDNINANLIAKWLQQVTT